MFIEYVCFTSSLEKKAPFFLSFFFVRLIDIHQQVTTTSDVLITAIPEQGELCDLGDGIDVQ